MKSKETKEIKIKQSSKRNLEIHEWPVEVLPRNLTIILELNFVQEKNQNK